MKSCVMTHSTKIMTSVANVSISQRHKTAAFYFINTTHIHSRELSEFLIDEQMGNDHVKKKKG